MTTVLQPFIRTPSLPPSQVRSPTFLHHLSAPQHRHQSLDVTLNVALAHASHSHSSSSLMCLLSLFVFYCPLSATLHSGSRALICHPSHVHCCLRLVHIFWLICLFAFSPVWPLFLYRLLPFAPLFIPSFCQEASLLKA